MIHVLNFNGEIIDFISKDDSALIYAKHNRDINERTETYNLTILSSRSTHFTQKNRVIIQGSDKRYREFIIEHMESSDDGYTEIEMSASYLEDISTAKPIAPGKFDKMTTSQALDEVLIDTGWQRSEETEYGGIRTTSWTSYQKRYEVLLQLCTTYKMSLDFYIELGSNRVKGRYVSLKEKNPLFKGKEIVKGKDLISLKRTVDLDEVRTALLCIASEKDDGTRIEVIVTDDEAQEQFGLPQRYIWDIYEPESDDSNMTEARLRTLGTTELNKRKVALISYEVTALDIKKENPHEIINLGDMVRIKDRDFNPPLYVEAEVIGEEYDPIAENSIYTFGQYKEYKETDLRKDFYDRLDKIQAKLNDKISNVNTIIQDTLADELQYYEQKIIKSDTPPENPVNDMLWYDTSNPDVAVLWRYFNGEWREHSVNDVEKIGGITREKALFSELNNTFINLSIQHSKLLNDVYEVLNSEYLVDNNLKNEVNSKINDTIDVFNQIKTNLESMTPETATIGKLVDTQALFLTYRERMQSLYIVVETAKISIDDYFKLLQSQYTEEKFKEAMQKVADKFGFELTEDGFKAGDGTLLNGIIQSIKEDTDEQFKTVVKKADYEVDQDNLVTRLNTADSERVQMQNEISDRVTLNEYEQDKVNTETTINTMQTSINQNGTDINARATKEEFNASKKTLSRVIADLTVNTTTGLSLTYDANGAIQSHVVGPDGIKIKGDRVDIQANKEFNVLVGDVGKKVGKDEIINRLNLSPEGLDINVNNVGIRGGDATNYISIKNNQMLSYGLFERSWAGIKDTAKLELGIKDGRVLIRNQTTNYRLYLTERGLSTMMDGFSTDTSGTLEFHSQRFNETSRGVTLHSTYGAVALLSEQSRIFLNANLTTNIESNLYSVYIRPYKNSRPGLNEFAFYVKDADSSGATDGALLYGNISDPDGIHGSGIRFTKSKTENVVYATNQNGDIGSGDFYADKLYGAWKAKTKNLYALVAGDIGELRVTDFNGATGSSINYKDIRVSAINTTHSYAFANHSGSDVYMGVGFNELRVTANNWWNGGKPAYQDVRARTFFGKTGENSSEKYKTNIEKWKVNASEMLRNTVFYEYNYKSDLEIGSDQKSHGVVIERETPRHFTRDNDSIHLYEVVSTIGKSLQEQIYRNDLLEEKIRLLEEQIS